MLTLFGDMSLPRWQKPNTSVVISDESSLTEDFCVYGALYFWWPTNEYKKQIATFERELTEIKEHYGLGTIKWEYVPKPSFKLEGHVALIKYLREQVNNHLRFKCMVVNTKKYPLAHTTINEGDELVGYMKYYTLHLADGIMLTQKGFFYDITIDDYSWRPKTGDTSIRLGKCVEGRYKNNFKSCTGLDARRYRHSELKTANDGDSNLLQMADLLTGAVAFCRNKGLERTSNTSVGRKELVKVIRECYGGVRLDMYQQKGAFAIWDFSDPEEGKRSLRRSPTAPGEVLHFP
jgi:hypothetical protein